MIEAMEPKKSTLESLAALLTAMGGARTPVGQAIVELGLLLGLIAGAGWIYERGPQLAKAAVEFIAIFGTLVIFALIARLLIAVAKQARKD